MIVLKVAQEELGYVEGPRSNESKYGQWYSGRRVAWCADFLTWCVNEVDIRFGTQLMGTVFPRSGASDKAADWFIDRGRFISNTGSLPKGREKQWLIGADTYMEPRTYIPSAGDYMWVFYQSPKLGAEHSTIVEGVSVDENGVVQIHVIEGNNLDRVQRAVYAIDDRRIYGFGTPIRKAYTNLSLYDKGDDVAVLEGLLVESGYMKARNSKNQVDKKLQQALKAYQKAKGLPVTGIWDLTTRTYMENGENIP